ncbi:hypothetical protein OSTOST_20301, partial [Ostertagia ostertagi]
MMTTRRHPRNHLKLEKHRKCSKMKVPNLPRLEQKGLCAKAKTLNIRKEAETQPTHEEETNAVHHVADANVV